MHLKPNDVTDLNQINLNLEKLLRSRLDDHYKIIPLLDWPVGSALIDVEGFPVVSKSPMSFINFLLFLMSRQIHRFPYSHSLHYRGPVGDVFHTFCDLSKPIFLSDVTRSRTNEYEYVFIPSYFIVHYLLAVYCSFDEPKNLIPELETRIVAELKFVSKYIGDGIIDPRLLPGAAMIVANLTLIMSKLGRKGQTAIIGLLNCVYAKYDDYSINGWGRWTDNWSDLYEGEIRYKEVGFITDLLGGYYAFVESTIVENELLNYTKFENIPEALKSTEYINPTIINVRQYPNLKYIHNADKDEKSLLRDRVLKDKTAELLIQLHENPNYRGSHCELLSNNLRGWKSIRTTKKDRIVYQVRDLLIVVMKLKGHY